MPNPIIIEAHKARWTKDFVKIGKGIRKALQNDGHAIHHIGSTSVPNLCAKDIIDIQITVADLKEVDAFRNKLETLGFTYRHDIRSDHCPPGMTLARAELEKRYFQIPNKVHCHVRAKGSFGQRYALLCRDYLRATPMAADAYGEIKQQLARYFSDDVEAYYDIKDPVFDTIMAGAFYWAEMTRWQPAESDA